MVKKLLHWTVDRFGLKPIWDNFLDRPVPKDPWYHGDGMALLLLLTIQLVTGVVLALSYTPSLDEAYESVYYITNQQVLGWFVRGLHYWSGGLMVVMLFIHFCRQILLGGYKFPREGTWLLGVILLFAVLTISLLGYILRWDERGIYGLRVTLAGFQQVPWIGDELVYLVQGGAEITTLTLTRLFATHVILLPLLILLVASFHVYLVVLHGTTSPAEQQEPIETVHEQREVYQAQAESPTCGDVFFPTAMLKMSPWSIIVFMLAIALTVTVGPRELLPEANLVQDTAPAEEWWFAWYSALVALLPPNWAPAFQVYFPLVVLFLLVLLPFVDRTPHRGWRNRPVAVAIVIVLVLGILVLSGLRLHSDWTAWPTNEPPGVPQGVILAEDAERGRMLFMTYGCTSCHSVAGSPGAAVGPDLARLRHRYSQTELRQYVLHPPTGVAMPSYAERIPEQDLESVVAFVLVAQTFQRTQE